MSLPAGTNEPFLLSKQSITSGFVGQLLEEVPQRDDCILTMTIESTTWRQSSERSELMLVMFSFQALWAVMTVAPQWSK